MWMRLFGVLLALAIIWLGVSAAHATVHHGFWLHFAFPWSIISLGAGLALAIVWTPLPSPNPYRRSSFAK